MKQLRIVVMMLLLASMAGMLMAQNAVSFDGTNDYVQVTPSLGISNTYTVEGWIYPTSLTSGLADIIQYGRTVFSSSTGSNLYPLFLTVYGSDIRLRTWTTNVTDQTVNAGLVPNTWYHIAVTSTKGGTTRLYLNGFEILNYNNANATTWPSSFTIGAIRPVRTPTILPFQGLIDEVRVWNTIRTPGDILTYMSVPVNPTSTGLVGYWNFDESAPGTTAYDSAGTAQNATLFGGASFTPSDLTLPIELSSFTATITSQYFVQLHWVTQSESDALGYMIFRSEQNDLANAYQVSPMINATNTATQANYSFTDQEVSPGSWYYWLQSIELNGNSYYHGPLLATVAPDQGGEAPGIPLASGIKSVYPNPFNPTVTIRYEMNQALPVRVDIYNTRGQTVQSYEIGTIDPGLHSLVWDANNLPAGIYLIQMKAGDIISRSKAVLSK